MRRDDFYLIVGNVWFAASMATTSNKSLVTCLAIGCVYMGLGAIAAWNTQTK